MLIKAGVDISRLNREIRKALNYIEELCPDFVITSTYEGTHSPSSLHYANDAIDVRKSEMLTMGSLRRVLGEGYDVVEEGDHWHIEYDPKG